MKVRSWSSNLGLPAAVVCVVIGSNFTASVNDYPVKLQSRIRRRNLRDFLRIFAYFSLDLKDDLRRIPGRVLAPRDQTWRYVAHRALSRNRRRRESVRTVWDN